MDLSVSLSDELARYVEAKMSSGRYESSSDVVSEALRLMETSERHEVGRDQWLREAWREGIHSGDTGEIDFTRLEAEARTRVAASKT